MTPKKADLHLHSKASNKTPLYALRKINCPESFTTPQCIYETAKKRGMDYVTLTDHNTINGALEIAHHADVFIGCEFTAKFPEVDTKIHVVALNLTEKIYQEANRIRRNVYELVEYLRAQKIVHFIAHPFFDHKGNLDLDTFEKILLLFNVFEEVNGTKTPKLNQFNARVLDAVTPERIEQLANKHDIAPFGEKPWIKGRVGGSDDHGGLFIGKTFTSAPANDLNGFLDAIENRNSCAGGDNGDHLTLAHAIYSIGYQFLKDKLTPGNGKSLPFMKTLLNTTFNPTPEKLRPSEKLRILFNRWLPEPSSTASDFSFENILNREAKKILDNREFQNSLSSQDLNRKIFTVTCHLANRLMYVYTERLTRMPGPLNLVSSIEALSNLGLVHLLVSPYFVSFYYSHRNSELIRDVEQSLLGIAEKDKPQKIALFTDTLEEINGVAITMKRMLKYSRENGIDLTIITASKGPTGYKDGVMNFQSTGDFSLPEYPEIQQHFPPILEVMDYIERENFTRIHVSTPGSLGILGLAISKLMNFPLTGTYHTDIPQYVKNLTHDAGLEKTAMNYMIWFYNHMDEVTVPSLSTQQQLIDNGLEPEKIKPLPRWVDHEEFTPKKQDAQFWKTLTPNDAVKFLYVGRLSKEKNLQVLAKSFKQIIDSGEAANLILVGDGPNREELERMLAGTPAVFTGVLTGENLCKAYASADVFVFPSTTDTWGNVVLEAQASGLPVIVTDQGGPRELMENGKTGFVVHGDDIEDLAGAMRFYIKNPAEIGGMGYHARSFILKNKVSTRDTYSSIFNFRYELRTQAPARPSQAGKGADLQPA